MKNRVAFMFAGLFPFICVALFAQDAKTGQGVADPVAGIHWAKGAASAQSHAASSPNLLYRGGPIMPTADVTAIFWGPTWSETDDKVLGMDVFYQGIGNTTYAGTCDEYTGQKKSQVASAISYRGHIIDSSRAPSNGNSTAPILSEVCKMIPGSQLVSNGYYPVYIDNPRVGNYCAWHSAGSCNGVNVQFGFFYKLDGDPLCDPRSTVPHQSQGLAAIANVSGHELSEAVTDPRLNAWYDSSIGENADKCSWTFGTPYLTFLNGTQWKIQGNWSNNAYKTGTGYPNYNGQKGCIDGGNY
jgi:hypothetical protein